MMVRERRYIFGVEDISSLIYACPKCSHEVECKLSGPSDSYNPGPRCVSCGEDLMCPTDDEGLDPHDVLLRNLRRVLRTDDPKVQVKFAVYDPE